MIEKVGLNIPDEYSARIATGELIRTGGVLRNSDDMTIRKILETVNLEDNCSSVDQKAKLAIGGALALGCVIGGGFGVVLYKKRVKEMELLTKSTMAYCHEAYEAMHHSSQAVDYLKISTISEFRDCIVKYPEKMDNLLEKEWGVKKYDFVSDVRHVTKLVAENTDNIYHFKVWDGMHNLDSPVESIKNNLWYQEFMITNVA